MKYIFSICIAMLFLYSCQKSATSPDPIPVTPPAMKFTDFGNIAASKGHPFVFDLDRNGTTDLLFSYMLTNDGTLNAEKHQFRATAQPSMFFPFDVSEQVPMLAKGAAIQAGSFNGHSWGNGATVMAEKIVTNTQPPFWRGRWKEASHAFLPLYFVQGQSRYFGWVELSFDIARESILLHRMAISEQPGVMVYAGY